MLLHLWILLSALHVIAGSSVVKRFGCLHERCVAVELPQPSVEGFTAMLRVAGAAISLMTSTDCNSRCRTLGEHEWLAESGHFARRGGLLVATPPPARAMISKALVLDDTGRLSKTWWASADAIPLTPGLTGTSTSVLRGIFAEANQPSLAVIVVAPSGPSCDITPAPTPPPPPPPPHCSTGICAGTGVNYPMSTEGAIQSRSQFVVPPIPPTFQPDAMTLYLYYNIIPNEAATDTYNQFVPQLTLGDSFCNGSGPPEYNPAASSLNPLKTWYIQAQYFFKVKCQNHSRAVFGDMVPVNPGDVIATDFKFDSNAAVWHISIEATAPNSSLQLDRRVSSVMAPYPFMNASISWLDNPYNEARLGSCWEVYNMGKASDYPESMIYTVDTRSPRAGNFWNQWQMNEKPTCPYSPRQWAVRTTNAVDNRSQHVDFLISQGELSVQHVRDSSLYV